MPRNDKPRALQIPETGEMLKAIEALELSIEGLGEKVDAETAARKKEKESNDNRAKWFRRTMYVMTAFTILSLVAAIGSYRTSQTQKQDRCQSGNKFRAQFVDLNKSNIEYLDQIIAISAKVQASQPRQLTPEQQQVLVEATQEFQQLHDAQLAKLKDPAFQQRKC